MELRPYQVAGVDAVLDSLASHDSTLLLLATGLGKTQCAVEVMRRWGGRKLFLAHRDELIQQAARRVEDMLGFEPDVEQAELRDAAQTDVLVGSVQTMCRPQRLGAHRPEAFSLIVVDEVHHAAAASYVRILEHFEGAKKLGLTATASRADGRKLGENFEDVAYEYDIRAGIRDGWLCPIRRREVHVTSLELDGVQMRGGDFVESQLEHRILENEATIHAWAVGILDHARDRKTLIFTPGVQSSQRLAEILNRYQPGEKPWAVHLDGETPRADRRSALAEFAIGNYQYVSNCGLFLEGFDEPSIACVAMCRPTKSHVLYVQCLGRGTRLHPSKTDLLVIDFTDASRRFDLVTAVDVLGVDEDPAVLIEARKHEDLTVDEAIAKARDIIEAQKREHEKRMREFMDAQTRSHVRARGQVVSFDVDADMILGVNRYKVQARARRFGAKDLSEKQWAMLVKAGFERPADPSEEDLAIGRSRLDGIFKRINAGLCTVKMEKTLVKNGFPAGMQMGTARAAMDWLARNRFRVSPAARENFLASLNEGGGMEDGT